MNAAWPAPWAARALAGAIGSLQAGRLPHAALITGPSHLGQRWLAEQLARALLCTAPAPAGGCGQCRNCRQFDARFQRDPAETRPDGSPAHPEGHPGHPDVRFVGFVLNEKSSPKKMYQELVIDQIRELSAWLVLSPQGGTNKVALIEPAHQLTTAAANALLKTLEEPVPGRYLMLVTDEAHRLPATIRSRCQRIELRLPCADEALDWLRAQAVDEALARAALAARQGHPGLAWRDIQSDAMGLRQRVARDLAAIALGRERATEVVSAWSDDTLAQRLQFAVEAVHQFGVAVARGRCRDSLLGLAGLSEGSDLRALTRWCERANRTRDQLRAPLRQDLMLGELLQAWRQACLQGVSMSAS